jgi:hypothetical protein
MSGVKAGIGIGMQDSGWWYPLLQDRSKILHLFLAD